MDVRLRTVAARTFRRRVAATPRPRRGYSAEPRRRRGRDVDTPRSPRRRRGSQLPRRGYSARGDAAAATWIFRGARGSELDRPRRSDARGRKRRWDVRVRLSTPPRLRDRIVRGGRTREGGSVAGTALDSAAAATWTFRGDGVAAAPRDPIVRGGRTREGGSVAGTALDSAAAATWTFRGGDAAAATCRSRPAHRLRYRSRPPPNKSSTRRAKSRGRIRSSEASCAARGARPTTTGSYVAEASSRRTSGGASART